MASSSTFQTRDGNYVADASDLGFRAGNPMPDTITTDGHRFNYVRTRRADGEVIAWDYISRDGALLVIFND